MQWLVANMWMALAAAAVLGLLFGFSFRGVLASSRVRKAEVEREIARTELTQSKAEAEALYAAQRKRKEESAQLASGDETLQAELTERENKIAALGEELRNARGELETLKADTPDSGNTAEVAGAAIVGAVAGAVLSDDDQKELSELRDRNTWLEDRVSGLEGVIAAASETPEPAAPDANTEKLTWQANYMRQRVVALESKLIAATTGPNAADAPSEQSPEADTQNDIQSANPADEELAQLRWRNRYLEGRLAYFEQTPDGEEEAEAEAEVESLAEPDSVQQIADLSEPEEEQVPESEPEGTSETDAETEPEPEPEPEPAPEAEPVTADTDTVPDAPDAVPTAIIEEDVHPSEAMLAELEGKQPVQVDEPSSGGDDLTTITGIGPRIAEVLNGLGIWTFTQIAEWQPEHETWIENHLSFKGRVSRENWVGQAKDLLVSA